LTSFYIYEKYQGKSPRTDVEAFVLLVIIGSHEMTIGLIIQINLPNNFLKELI